MHPSRRRLACFLLASSSLVACPGKTISYETPSTSGAGGSGAGGSTVVSATTTGTSGAAISGGASGGTMSGDINVSPFPGSKLDLLFLIDNSSSMADKQAILAQAVPDLLNRLVDPACIDPMTGQQVGIRRPDGSCAVGVPQFDPMKDIHIGIITSSLGGHGATGVCDDPDPRKTLPHNDDHAHLIARDIANGMETSVPTFQNRGFLNWNPTQMPGQTPADILTPFATIVRGVGQHGCGYEASLEAIYRFLIDPDPPQSVVIQPSPTNTLGVAALNGVDTALLQQRSDFLRPDSLVAVMMITDENDCSIQDVGQGFYSIIPASGTPPTGVLGHGTTPCKTNPNDPCCYNCGQATPNGCPDNSADPECQAGPLTRDIDPENLRCWQQKRRYGFDFLYPVSRYIDGFSKSTVPNRAGSFVRNPLFDDLSPICDKTTRVGCSAGRDTSAVFLAGIVGVPWQDVAVDPSDLTKGYLSARQLVDQNVWQKILGDPHASPPVPPTDSHMIESITPRPGIPGPASSPTADPFNGHEWDPSMAVGQEVNPSMGASQPNADLQYACVFTLNPTRVCIEQTDCDCFVPAGRDPAAAKNPLCQNGSGQYTNVQVRAKGYPGLRELEVLKGLGDQAVVASICPANVNNPASSDFGYRPAVAALVSRFQATLGGRGCLAKPLPLDASGQADCHLIEAFNPPPGATCNCLDKPGRVTADSQIITPEVRAHGTCFCEIVQLTDPDKTICKMQVNPPGSVLSGWCYVDPGAFQDTSQCALVQSCPRDEERLVRFVSPDSQPRAGAGAFLHCAPSVPTPSMSVCP